MRSERRSAPWRLLGPVGGLLQGQRQPTGLRGRQRQAAVADSHDHFVETVLDTNRVIRHAKHDTEPPAFAGGQET